MTTRPFHPRFEDLPKILPIFAVPGVMLLPDGKLPLNIFEPRYLTMVTECLSNQRLIGIIQPNENGKGPVGTPPPPYLGRAALVVFLLLKNHRMDACLSS